MSEQNAATSGQWLRVFVAVPVPPDTAEQLRATQSHLAEAAKQQEVKLRLTPSHQLHLTLAFLGNLDQSKLSSVLEATASVTQACASCALKPQGFVALPSVSRARVIAVAFEEPTGRLAAFTQSLHDSLRRSGCELEDRAFFAHITLARMRFAQRAPNCLARWVEGMSEMQTREVAVFQSILKPSGAEYRRLLSVRFKSS